MNRDMDSDLLLCQPCGDRFDEQNGIVVVVDGRPLIYGTPYGRDAELHRPEPRPWHGQTHHTPG